MEKLRSSWNKHKITLSRAHKQFAPPAHTWFPMYNIYIYMCVCVCLCVRACVRVRLWERESVCVRERERERENNHVVGYFLWMFRTMTTVYEECVVFDYASVTKCCSSSLTASPGIVTLIARFMGPTWAHLGPTGPRWGPCWPQELRKLGMSLPPCWANRWANYSGVNRMVSPGFSLNGLCEAIHLLWCCYKGCLQMV